VQVAVVKVMSAGAAQAVVEKIADAFSRETGHQVNGEFSAVGAIRQRVLEGAAADIIILTAAMIDELASIGYVVTGSRADLGKVGTGVAVKAGGAVPDVSSAQALRERLLTATKVVCPDPAVATAGKVVLQVLDKLGIADRVKPNMQYFPNGYAAMHWLSENPDRETLGITQITEIRANPGVTFAGPLPGDLQAKTVYSAGLAARAVEAGAARDFIARLTSPGSKGVLAAAGYEFD
jgi:molybdate transport system substrate-binding protein